jgi:membrane associated rhomboid family serine protease/Zn-finger nucleic acid-binding protein
MFTCPHCRCHLERLDTTRGAQWRCPTCEGRSVTIPVLRRMMEADYVNQLWRAARDAPRDKNGVPCPLCANGMTVVQNLVSAEDGAIHVDVCRSCHAVWFDTHELDSALARTELPEEEKGPELSDRAREVIALAEIERIRARADQEDLLDTTPPVEGWKAILTVFGLPMEENVPPTNRLPWVTWGVILLMALATAWTDRENGKAIAEWGLVPAELSRHGGLTFLTAFFLHAGWWHFFGNAVFLAVFGDNVEDFLGHGRFALLLMGASLTGDVLHMAFDTRDTTPLVGASGGISGVIVFYALQFPKARLVYLFRFGFVFRWVRFSAVTGLLIWLALQSVGVWHQMSGYSRVSFLGHLGGAAFGLVWWLMSREKKVGEI